MAAPAPTTWCRMKSRCGFCEGRWGRERELAKIVATANLGWMLQLQAGVRMHGAGQKVMHVVEVLDQAYKNAK